MVAMVHSCSWSGRAHRVLDGAVRPRGDRPAGFRPEAHAENGEHGCSFVPRGMCHLAAGERSNPESLREGDARALTPP
jgi:hypothetical protein